MKGRARAATGALILCAALLPGVPVLAVPAGAAPSLDSERFEGLTIDRIDFVAPPREHRSELLQLSGLEVGRVYRAEDIRSAIKVLYQTGRFENVRARAWRDGNIVDLELSMEPRPFARQITILGGPGYGRNAIDEGLGLKINDDLDVQHFAERRLAVEEALRRIGYRSAAVGLAVQNQDPDGGAELVVRIDEGPATRLRQIVVRGVPRRPLWQIQDQLGLARGGVLNMQRIEAALKRLHEDYKKRGYVEVKIAPPAVRAVKAGPGVWADLVLTLDAGPKVRVRFRGQHGLPTRELKDAAAIIGTVGTGHAALAEVRERILARYERRGYWRAIVEPAVRVSADRSAKEVLFLIQEGTPARVRSVDFPGLPELPELGPDVLREKIRELVQQALGEEFDWPDLNTAVLGTSDPAPGTQGRDQHKSPPEPPNDAGSLYIERAYRAATDAIGDLFRDQGFENVVVSPPTVDVKPDGRSLSISIPIQPGIRWRVRAVDFSGNRAVPAYTLLDESKIDAEERPDAAPAPLSFYRLETARQAIQTYYRNNGYLYARVEDQIREVGQRDALSDLTTTRTSTHAPTDQSQACRDAERYGKPYCEVELAFRIHEGPQVHVRKIRPPIGVVDTRESLVEGEVTLKEGEILRDSQIQETQRNLQRLGVFRRVQVHPVDEATESALKDVVVEVTERKASAFEIGAGAATEDGVRVFAGYTHGNLFGSAVRLQSNAQVNVQPFLFLYNEDIRPAIRSFFAESPIQYAFSVGLSIPRILGLPRGLGVALDASVLHHNDPAFREETRKLTLTVDYNGLRWRRASGVTNRVFFQFRTSFDWSDLACNTALGDSMDCGDFSDNLLRRNQGTTFYVGLRPSMSLDLRDDPFNPRAGFYTEIAPELLVGVNATSPNHVNFQSKMNGYVPTDFLAKGSSLAFSFLWWQIFHLEDPSIAIPVNRRFFAGGRSTIRGYVEQTLFPRDMPATMPGVLSPGGYFFVALKNEFRFPLTSGLSGTIFYDIGDLYNRFEIVVDESTRQGLGLGIRYATPIGPLLLDLALWHANPSEFILVPHFAAVGTF